MAERTPFAGLMRLAPGDRLSEENFAFQNENPSIIDQLLRLAMTHRHDGHAALVDPTEDPVLATGAVGGVIPADLALTVGYTLIDADGGETVLNTEPGIIATTEGLADPTDGPLLEPDTLAGTLLAGSYGYAVSVTDDGGGETGLGPTTTVEIPPGSQTNQVVISGLDAIVDDAGGTGWRLWRQVNGGGFNLIEDGNLDEITDDGTLCPNCNVSPPISGSGTTNATNTITVTVPATNQDADAVSFRIYASLDGTFSNPSLLGEYDVDQFDVAQVFTELTFLDGSPPEVSRSFPGADPILLSDFDIRWREPVATMVALEALTADDNTDGDVRVVLEDYTLHIWNDGDSVWEAVGGGEGGGHTIYALNGEALPQQPGLMLQKVYGGADLDLDDEPMAFVTVISIPHKTGWITVNATGGGGAVEFPAGYSDGAVADEVVRFRVTSDGSLEFSGRIFKATDFVAGDVILQLPESVNGADLRPTTTQQVSTVSGDDATARAFGALDFEPDGDVVWQAGEVGAGNWISLNGFTIRP